MGTTGLTLAVLVRRMSASLLAVTLMLDVLLPGTGSGSVVLIPAVLPRTPGAVAVATIVITGMLVKLAPAYPGRVQLMVASQVQPVPVADTSVSPAPRVSVTVMGVAASDTPPFRRGVRVYVTLSPTPTLARLRVLVMDTSAPSVAVTLAELVLLAVLPSGMAESSGLRPLTANAAVTVPFTLATAGTVSSAADAPLARVPLRVHVTVPLLMGYPEAGVHDQPAPVGTPVMDAPLGTEKVMRWLPVASSGPLLATCSP